MSSSSDDDLARLQALVGHREFVYATETLESVHRRFTASRQDFFAVLDGRTVVGLCARRDIGTVLGARFGFALHAREGVSNHLTAQPLRVTVDQPLPLVLNAIAHRRDEHFYDDVLLSDGQGEFLGLIYVRDLVRLQNNLLLENLAEIATRNRRMEDDLQMARAVQVALLPREYPVCPAPGGNALQFAQLFEPADGVSGDFFDLFPVYEHAVGIIICDVMGHGVRSALITAMTRALLEELREHAGSPADFLTRVNAQLTRLLRRSGELIFVTMSFAVIDAAAQQLIYAHAGHPPPLHWSAATRKAVCLPDLERIGGPAIGLVEDHHYEVAQIPFAAGDRVLFYTDGITEAASSQGEEFGIERLTRALEEIATDELARGLSTLREIACRFAGRAAFTDDVCLIACELGR